MTNMQNVKSSASKTLNELISEAKKIFKKNFDSLKNIQISSSPASVMILGDHTHYNDGIILLTTINSYAIAVASLNDNDQTNLVVESPDFSTSQNSDNENELVIKCGNLYLGNLLFLLKKKGYIKSGFNLVLYSNIPQSVGMGFVAANQFAFVNTITKLFELNFTPEMISDLCIEAEKSYLGKMTNPAHYFAIMNGTINSLIKVDLRYMTFELFNVLLKDYNVVVFDNSIEIPNPREICNERINECSTGVKALRLYIWGIKNLRDVSIEFLARHTHVIPNIIYKRILYTVKEKIRVETGIEFIKNNYFPGLAKLMFESHKELREDYEIGNTRHDEIVSLLLKQDGVLGAKIISCSNIESVICFIKKRNVNKISQKVVEDYKELHGHKLNFWVFNSTDGTNFYNN
ncbi:MAG: galactokinase [Ignavibacteriales bacterium]